MTGTCTPSWTTPSSGLRYSMMPVTAKMPILYEQGEIGYHTRQMAPWLDKVKVAITGGGWSSVIMGRSGHQAQRDKLVTQIIDDLKEYGVAKETLAMDVWDPGLIEGFQAKGIKVVPATELMFDARSIKNQDEVECLRIASAIGDAQMQTVKDMLKPGVKENEIMGSMHKTAYDLGGEVYSGMLDLRTLQLAQFPVYDRPYRPAPRHRLRRRLQHHLQRVPYLLLPDLLRGQAAPATGGCL